MRLKAEGTEACTFFFIQNTIFYHRMVKPFCIYTLKLSQGVYPFLSTGDLAVIAGFVIYGLLCLVVRKELEFWYVPLMSA